ncbi:hypothetical protein GMLC_30050 [Geomonas limicola]|uniref:Phosphatidic acid phosphatase type 2/haloperoxidase domain-containing protein n=1 Tax=Geomonas limicola TaxID=2740186 RepID=A0A6V8NA49_9BACT|nr:phosphatase PAP2 family protein [Geomonas limicola]GFO69426.1 hypothetical protein GMLC_30050 [Geomonas limicola]
MARIVPVNIVVLLACAVQLLAPLALPAAAADPPPSCSKTFQTNEKGLCSEAPDRIFSPAGPWSGTGGYLDGIALPPPAPDSGAAAAQGGAAPESSKWRWRRAGLWDSLGSGLGIGATLFSESVYGEPGSPRWSARNGFDEGVRDLLRISSKRGREVAEFSGDLLMGTLIGAPVVDALATLGVRDRNWDALWQTEMVNLESFAFTSLASSVLMNTIRREKPYARTCVGTRCEDYEQRNRSMPSGHVAFAFTGAGLICTHHAYQHLYQDPGNERLVCGTSLGVAAATGLLRIMADRHYTTDVLAGAGLGLISGFLLPRLLHYGFGPPAGTAQEGEGGATQGSLTLVPKALEGGAALICEVQF